MRRALRLDEDRLVRVGAGLTGAILFASAALAGELARAHQISLGTLCGAGSHLHCGWCYAAAGLVLAGLAALLVAVRSPAAFRKSGLSKIKAQLSRP